MKTVLFDLFEAQPAGTSKFHGGGEYIKTVYQYLAGHLPDECSLIVFYNDRSFLDPWILDSFADHRIKAEVIHRREEVRYLFDRHKIDSFYSGLPYFYKKAWIPETVRVCGTIHGLRGVELPCDRYAYKYATGRESRVQRLRYLLRGKIKEKKIRQFRDCMELLDEIVCVSNHTRYAIRNYFPSMDRHVRVFYTPAKYVGPESGMEKECCHREVEGKYILLGGADRSEKNGYRAVRALEELFREGMLEGYRVVTVGGMPGKITEIIHRQERYVCLGYVEAGILENLYRYCDLFLYPSLNEGFGMPPLEAMKYGKTCIVSGVTSLPEICGDAVYYCNPYDIDEIKNRLLMAAEQKIPAEKIENHLRGIRSRQDADLKALCEYITGRT